MNTKIARFDAVCEFTLLVFVLVKISSKSKVRIIGHQTFSLIGIEHYFDAYVNSIVHRIWERRDGKNTFLCMGKFIFHVIALVL